jgi:hypothetical protein
VDLSSAGSAAQLKWPADSASNRSPGVSIGAANIRDVGTWTNLQTIGQCIHRLADSFPKRDQRIHSGNTTGGYIARSKGDEHQHCGGDHEGDRIRRAESREERGQRRRDQK